jgi:hypothetical protein
MAQGRRLPRCAPRPLLTEPDSASPGEAFYSDFSILANPYSNGRVVSPYGLFGPSNWNYYPRPNARYYTKNVHQTIELNKALNARAQRDVNAKEPTLDIWGGSRNAVAPVQTEKAPAEKPPTYDDSKASVGASDSKGRSEKHPTALADLATNVPPARLTAAPAAAKSGFFSRLIRSNQALPSTSARSSSTSSLSRKDVELVNEIEAEEAGRWRDAITRNVAMQYQDKTGMSRKVAQLRQTQPLQYLHLLRAGYFEPIPVAWANSNSNPLKFSIEAASGWRGITPQWRGYEDTGASDRACGSRSTCFA